MMEDEMITMLPLDIMASSCAAIAAFSLVLVIINVLRQLEVERQVDEDVKQLPVIFKLLLPFTPVIVKMIQGESFAARRELLQKELQKAGYDQTISPAQFIAVRILSLIVGIMFLILTLAMQKPLMGVLVVVLLFAYPGVWLNTTVHKRHLQIQKALPTVLDLLTLSIEAGKDFITALRDILNRRRRDALGEELSRTLQEIQLGKQRSIALKDLSRRVQQSDLTSVVNSIIQADELGVSIGQLLRIQGDQLRGKRFQRAEKLANEAPVKILFPVVMFIFPAVIIMLMAPIVMQAFQSILM